MLHLLSYFFSHQCHVLLFLKGGVAERAGGGDHNDPGTAGDVPQAPLRPRSTRLRVATVNSLYTR